MSTNLLKRNKKPLFGGTNKPGMDLRPAQRLNIPVELVDERLSTVEANKVLINSDMSRKKRKKVIDSVAATIILQNYLDRKGK